MGEVVLLSRSRVGEVECGDPLSQRFTNHPEPRINISTISALFQSATDHLKEIAWQLDGYKEILRESLEFHKRCMAATELPSLAELLRAREALLAPLPPIAALNNSRIQ